MSFDIEFNFEIEQLGITLAVWAEYLANEDGIKCQDITATVIDENDANDQNVWEGLAELYIKSSVNIFFTVQSIVQDMADKKAIQEYFDGAGQPDPDAAYDAAREDDFMAGR
jgi:hypothetical protein